MVRVCEDVGIGVGVNGSVHVYANAENEIENRVWEGSTKNSAIFLPWFLTEKVALNVNIPMDLALAHPVRANTCMG